MTFINSGQRAPLPENNMTAAVIHTQSDVISVGEDAISSKQTKKPLAQVLNLVRPFPKRADFADEDQYLDKAELAEIRLSPKVNAVKSEMSYKKDKPTLI